MSEAFDDLIAAMDGAMVVVTTAAGDDVGGCLVGFHAQCSIEPPVHQPAFEPCPGLCRPAIWKRGACLRRRPQISELMS